jgi:hypothetical protein
MNTRTKLLGAIAFAVFALATWLTWFQAKAPLLQSSALRQTQPETEPAVAVPPAAGTSGAVATPARPRNLTEPQPPQPIPNANELNENTLPGTRWERDGFGLQFGAGGKLLISGRERAKWRVEGRRIRLYHDTTGEEHWLDIVGDKLLWEGQEIGRVH